MFWVTVILSAVLKQFIFVLLKVLFGPIVFSATVPRVTTGANQHLTTLPVQRPVLIINP